jgi:hypothetical protein
MKIALVHLGFFYSGGGEKLVFEEVRGLRARGPQVDCYAPFVERQGALATLIRMAKDAVALLSYHESSLLEDIPGWGLHLHCTKQPIVGLEADGNCRAGRPSSHMKQEGEVPEGRGRWRE